MLRTFIITGDTDGGKTLFIKDLTEFLSLFEPDIQGFCSKGIFTSEGIKDFAMINLSDRSEIHLSTRSPRINYLPAGKFYFNPEAIEKGEAIVDSAIRSKTRILIIDEIGPIELNDMIWAKSLYRILSEYEGVLIITIRLKLIEKVIEKFMIHEAFIENIDKTTPRKTGEAILSLLNN